MNEGDIRDLLGMRSRAAQLIIVFYACACSLAAVATRDGISNPIPVVIAIFVCVLGALVLVSSPGDPLGPRTATALVLVGPVSSGLVFAVVPDDLTSPLQTWPLGASVAIYTFMCVRGRPLLAWVGLTLMIGCVIVWAVAAGHGALYGFSLSIINAAPLLMATFFAFTLRPLGKSVFALRQASTIRIASEAAASAALEERDAQLTRLDRLARPLLERIASGPDLTPEEYRESALLEAHLRDTMRAAGLIDPAIDAAAKAARDRGVEVVMLDDHGITELDDDARHRLATSVADQLDSITAGAVTVRLLPPGRTSMATILVTGPEDHVRRLEFGHDGSRVIVQ